MMPYDLILASASPRRKDLLGQLSIPFRIIVPAIDEVIQPGELPDAYVKRNASTKSLKVMVDIAANQPLVIAADTIVVCKGRVLEKPIDAQHARAMLTMLSNTKHQVITGVSLRHKLSEELFTVSTEVQFKPLSTNEIDRYIATGEPFDKAGAYAAQGQGSYFVQSLQGSYTNVVGLPMAELYERMKYFFPELM